MFTGLVEELGAITDVIRTDLGARFSVRCPWADLVIGESIAVSGVCISVTSKLDGGFTFDATAETLAKTTFGAIERGAEVHLERAMRPHDRLGGHIVTGHIDGVGAVHSISPLGDARRLEIEVPEPLAPFIAPKASIAVEGVSLTINGASGTRFDVVLIPITREKTRLDRRAPGAPVNLEVDVLAKYVARLLGRPGVDGRPASNPPVRGDQ